MRPTYTVIDLAAIRSNLQVCKNSIGGQAKLLAVVKANAYGHGSVEVARAAVDAGAEYLAVAIPEEGLRLREAGLNANILILGAILPESADMAVENDLIATVFTPEQVLALEAAAKKRNKPCRVHIKIDTGMNRIGLKTEKELTNLLTVCGECRFVTVEGMFTHFAVSEIADKSFTRYQAERFMAMDRAAKSMGYRLLLHAANSGAILELPELRFDMVRAGIAMYGYHPAGGGAAFEGLIPVMSWYTRVTHVKEIQPGETVSYGRRFTAKEPVRVATLPVGYGDGYKRCLTGKSRVLLNNEFAPVLGTICMDQMMVDVTHIPGVEVGDTAVLMGKQGERSITADDLADMANTISYEILLSINERVPRTYIG